MTALIINSVISLVAIIMFADVLRTQIALKHKYSYNGFRGIRIANISTTLLLMLLCLMRIFFFVTEIISNSYDGTQVVIYYINGIIIFGIAYINFVFHRGGHFEYLSKKKTRQ